MVAKLVVRLVFDNKHAAIITACLSEYLLEIITAYWAQ